MSCTSGATCPSASTTSRETCIPGWPPCFWQRIIIPAILPPAKSLSYVSSVAIRPKSHREPQHAADCETEHVGRKFDLMGWRLRTRNLGGCESLVEHDRGIVGGLRLEYVPAVSVQYINLGALKANHEVKSRIATDDADAVPGPKAYCWSMRHFAYSVIECFNERLALLSICDLGFAEYADTMKVLLCDSR